MENIGYVVFICFALPFLLGIPIVKKQMRQILVFIFIGMCCCLFISEINSLIYEAIRQDIFDDLYYMTTNITPVTEEVIKALPILLFAIFISSERQTLLTNSFMVGLGFALLENSSILVETVIKQGSFDILWALMRTLGAGLLHSLCTTSVGVGISFIRDQKKFFLCGTFALLAAAIVYHSIFNSLIMADVKELRYAGAVMPMVTYLAVIAVLVLVYRKGKKKDRPAKVEA